MFPDGMPANTLDIGCGIGTWIRAASNMGNSNDYALDGVDIPAGQPLISADRFCCKILLGLGIRAADIK